MDALLIIDMQKGMFNKGIFRYESDNVILRINQIMKKMREKSGIIIFIQHAGNIEDGFIPNTIDWEILDEIPVSTGDFIVHKTSCDSFYRTNLEELLSQNIISRIFITGCATDYCVDTTIRSAVSKDHNVVVVKDGHTTANRPNISAEQVINHHNWVWENLILPEKNLKVIATSEVLHLLDQ